MNKILLDSNIIIGAIKGRFPVSQLGKFLLSVSEITRLEIFGYHKLELQEEKLLNQFFRNIDCLPVSTKIINQAISIRKQRSMSIGDAIIAATASVYKLPFATANIKDFKHLEDLELVNPLNL